ncbi:hypothetical protein CC80DRAFT_288443 [Byssothecium circinans]|uniref:Uncharacterized protein n=1 Tax=Byssothecium circinans TaxID=147558 RepID=A0A6A5UGJ6_9PLEO|nr:hypothetical protein CC80DRAFT_288443 [Byssothecium circinans]
MIVSLRPCLNVTVTFLAAHLPGIFSQQPGRSLNFILEHSHSFNKDILSLLDPTFIYSDRLSAPEARCPNRWPAYDTTIGSVRRLAILPARLAHCICIRKQPTRRVNKKGLTDHALSHDCLFRPPCFYNLNEFKSSKITLFISTTSHFSVLDSTHTPHRLTN